MPEITITQIRPLMRPLQHGGDFQAASFTAQYGGISLKECRIVRKLSGTLVALPPRHSDRSGNGRGGVRFIDRDLWKEFQAKAITAYNAASGIDQQGEAGAGADDDGNLKSMLERRRA